jgi:hypothetical protein
MTRDSRRITRDVGVRIATTSRPVSDTRNDLLFTMSDITHSPHALRAGSQVHHAIKYEFVFLTDEIQAESKPDWWSQTGSNRRPPACKAGALPAELWPQKSILPAFNQPPSTAFRHLHSANHVSREGWWAWEDLNFRPHAYQARALTN